MYSHGKFIKEGNNWVYLLSVVSDNLGSSLMTFVLPLIVLDLTGSGIHLSIISSLETLPFLLLGLPFGAIVDRCDVRKVLIPFRCHQIRRIRVARGGSFGSEQRDRDADSHLSRHLGHRVHQCVQLSFRDNVHLVFRVEIGLFEDEQHRVRHPVHGRAAHPACLYSVVPMGLLALICAACFLLSAGAILLMRVGSSKGAGGLRGPVPAAVRTVIGDTRQGLSYLKTRRVVLYPLVLAALFNLLTGNFQNDSLVIMRKSLSFTSGQVGLVMSVTAMGALAGTFIVNLLNRSFKFETVLIANFLVQMCFRLLFVAFGNIFAVAATLFVVDLCQSVLNIIIITNRQNLVETRYLGRVTSIYKAVLIGVNSLGFIYGGTLSNTFGPRNAVLWSGVEILILTMIGIGAYAHLNKERTTDE
ncbi:MFS transporter [Bifidobacterium breve]|uniref:MFS transporter n=1 Tax=Bifidobacterium breve TaxID=1685 RepID=UPI000B21D45A|nr:MFS transporter [Bifidobacterium breve]